MTIEVIHFNYKQQHQLHESSIYIATKKNTYLTYSSGIEYDFCSHVFQSQIASATTCTNH